MNYKNKHKGKSYIGLIICALIDFTRMWFFYDQQFKSKFTSTELTIQTTKGETLTSKMFCFVIS